MPVTYVTGWKKICPNVEGGRLHAKEICNWGSFVGTKL
jgi:hypothetical protein